MKITIEVAPEILAGCVSIMRTTGMDTQNFKLEEIVAYTLASEVYTYADDGVIPVLTSTQAEKLLADAFGPPERTRTEKRTDNLRRAIEEGLARVTQEKVPDTVAIHEVDEPEEEPIDLDHPPWRNVERIPFEDIREASPKDILVLQAQTEGDAVLKKALEVGYAQFPMTSWASPQCTKIVAALYKEFGRYEEVIDS